MKFSKFDTIRWGDDAGCLMQPNGLVIQSEARSYFCFLNIECKGFWSEMNSVLRASVVGALLLFIARKSSGFTFYH